MKHFAAIITALAAASVSEAQPIISFDKNLVTVNGITPGGDVACLGVWRQPGETMPQLLRWERVVRDDDGDGVVAFDPGRDIPPVSVWAVADVSTGASEVVPGPGTDPRPAAMAADLLDTKRDGTFAFADRRAFLELLVVRPGEGAWAVSAGDGGENDDDKAPDGVVVPAIARLHPLMSAASRPAALRAGDVVVAIDPDTFEYYSVRLGRVK